VVVEDAVEPCEPDAVAVLDGGEGGAGFVVGDDAGLADRDRRRYEEMRTTANVVPVVLGRLADVGQVMRERRERRRRRRCGAVPLRRCRRRRRSAPSWPRP
jgi:hypothetical protein